MVDQPEVKAALLEPLETAVVPATTTAVIIRDCFNKKTGVRFSTVFPEFKNRFFNKTEGPAAEVTYRKYKLLQISADGPVIAELGGGREIEGTFAAAFAFLQEQPNGEPGFLQTNDYANLFYVRDKNKELCALRLGWAGDGWVVDAMPVADPLPWHGEHLIFCPLSESVTYGLIAGGL
jgi:hypothetical protein